MNTRGDQSVERPTRAEKISGRYIIACDRHDQIAARRSLINAGIKIVAASSGIPGGPAMPGADREALMIERLALSVVNLSDADAARLKNSIDERQAPGLIAIESDEVVHAINGQHDDYVRGYRDGVNDLSTRLLTDHPPSSGPGDTTPVDLPAMTWGLRAIGADATDLKGDCIKVAVLDTGMDFDHPDFKGRSISAKSFIDGEDGHDGHGHGTHCIGIACGPRDNDSALGYGVAPSAKILAGKVLSQNGAGSVSTILLGIEWALQEGASVISLSLGAARRRDANQPAYPASFEQAGQVALERGAVIVAAAGNEGTNPDYVVGMPANCPSILAIGGVDQALAPAPFSNPSSGVYGGDIDLVAPGVNILSSLPTPQKRGQLSGTSMAAPFVAGALALLAEAYPNSRGRSLASRLFENSMRLDHPSIHVGLGLVRIAP